MGIHLRTLQATAGVLGFVIGAFFLFFTSGFSTLVDPDLRGLDWWMAVVEMIWNGGMFTLGLGSASLIDGIWLLFLARRSETLDF